MLINNSFMRILGLLIFVIGIAVFAPFNTCLANTKNVEIEIKNILPQTPEDLKAVAVEIERQVDAVVAMRRGVPTDKALAGWHFVVDLGHGDEDPGAIRTETLKIGTQYYSESIMTLDIARRLGWYLRQRGASGVYFTLGPQDIVSIDVLDKYSYWHPSYPPNPLLSLKTLLPGHPYADTEVKWLLTTRTEVANQKVARYGAEKVIFLSVHVDSTSSDLQGLSIYYPPGGSTKLAKQIIDVSNKRGWGRFKAGHVGYYHPLMKAEFIVILPEFNDCQEKILIETANINSDHDFYYLKRGEGRESIAQAISEGVVMYVQSTKKSSNRN